MLWNLNLAFHRCTARGEEAREVPDGQVRGAPDGAHQEAAQGGDVDIRPAAGALRDRGEQLSTEQHIISSFSNTLHFSYYAIQSMPLYASNTWLILLYSRVQREFTYLIPKMDNETIETDFYELVLYFWWYIVNLKVKERLNIITCIRAECAQHSRALYALGLGIGKRKSEILVLPPWTMFFPSYIDDLQLYTS